MRSAMLAAMALPLLVMSCLYCAAPVSQSKLDRIGDESWRVLDADRIDMLESNVALRELHRRAVECAGQSRPFDGVKVFATNAIIVRFHSGWKNVVGFYTNRRIYIVRGLTPQESEWVVIHEFLHYIMRQSHPEIDPLLVSCGIPVKLERESNG